MGEGQFWEWLMSWAHEIEEVSGIFRKALFVELPAIETESKEA